MRTIGENIKTQLQKQGMTKAALSRATEIEFPLIWRYMVGQRSPSTYNLYRLSKALNCTMEDLCEGVFE